MNNFPPAILSPSDPCSPVAVPYSKTALLLLDFHKFICASQPNGAAEPLAHASALRTWARSVGIKIVHCCIDLKASTPLHRKMAARANTIRDAKAKAAPEEIAEHASIAALADEYTFWRPPSHVSAMGSYGLKEFLQQYDINSLILAGFSSSGCVINTAKGAADEGFLVTVVKDASADRNAAVHDMIMGSLLITQCHIVGREELTAAFEGRDLAGETEKLAIA